MQMKNIPNKTLPTIYRTAEWNLKCTKISNVCKQIMITIIIIINSLTMKWTSSINRKISNLLNKNTSTATGLCSMIDQLVSMNKQEVMSLFNDANEQEINDRIRRTTVATSVVKRALNGRLKYWRSRTRRGDAILDIPYNLGYSMQSWIFHAILDIPCIESSIYKDMQKLMQFSISYAIRIR